MGTNYYYQPQDNECPHCGHNPSQKMHIGKSSAGWYFALHVYDDGFGPKNLEDWRTLWESGGFIEDEYGDRIDASEMMTRITKRSWDRKSEDPPYGYSSWGLFHQQNSSEMGINGLLRHDMSRDRGCVGHGESTYSMFNREFS